MKYSLTVSIFPVFVLLIKGSECGSRSSKDISEVTNKVQVDYTQQKRGSGDGPEPLTWIWEPHPNQKNEIKFEPVIAFFENDKESGFDGDEREMHHDDQDVYPTNQQGEWTFTQVSNQKKSKGSKKNKTVVEKGYLPYYKHLKKTNWCFKGVKDYNYHKFKVGFNYYSVNTFFVCFILFTTQHAKLNWVLLQSWGCCCFTHS